MIHDDDNHDQRYEDGDTSTGTIADHEDWLAEDGESQWLPIPPWRTTRITDEEARDLLTLDGPYGDDWAKREGMRQMIEQGY